eukprot:scaffold2719_cov17-Prasinocladus_malaysianus.AAC.1
MSDQKIGRDAQQSHNKSKVKTSHSHHLHAPPSHQQVVDLAELVCLWLLERFIGALLAGPPF